MTAPMDGILLKEIVKILQENNSKQKAFN